MVKKKPGKEKEKEKKEEVKSIKIVREFVNTNFNEVKKKETEEEETTLEDIRFDDEESDDGFFETPMFVRRRRVNSDAPLEQTASTASAPVKAVGGDEEQKPFSYTGSPVGYAALGYEAKTEQQKTRQELWTTQSEGQKERDMQTAQQAQYVPDKEEDKGSETVRKRMF